MEGQDDEYGYDIYGYGEDSENEQDDYLDYGSDEEYKQEATYTESKNLSYQGLGQDFGVDETGKRLLNSNPDQIFVNKLIETAKELDNINKKIRQADKELFKFTNSLDSFIKNFSSTDSNYNTSFVKMSEVVDSYIKNPLIKKQQLNYVCFLIAVAMRTNKASLVKLKNLCQNSKYGTNETLFKIDNISVKSIDIYRYYRFISDQTNRT